MVQNIPVSAFTVTYKGITNQLKTKAILSYNGTSLTVDALWDTGATCTAISEEVAKQMALISTGKMDIKTPTGEGTRNTYLVDIQLPNDVDVPDVTVCDSEIGNQGIGLLIGMNIIGMGDFCVSNYSGKTIFSFRTPSQQPTDYVAQINVQNKIGQKHGPGKRKKKKK